MNSIIVRRRSVFTGNINLMELPISEQEYKNSMEMRDNGILIQDAFPSLNADQREFLMTGATPEEWKIIFGEENDS